MLDLKSYLKDKQSAMDQILENLLPDEATRPAVIHKAMRYCVFSGGKRLRPILAIAAAEAVGSIAAPALRPAAAIELLHTYTLVHDDLPCMDDDDFRRGKPTCHKVFGEANAVLAGDALQALAFEIIGQCVAPGPYPPFQLLLELARAAGSQGVVGGQVEDIEQEGKALTREQLHYIHQHKTADLFEASTRIGAIAGRANSEQLAALTTYGREIGLAFQIMDDLLDAAAENQPTGETTCLSVYTADQARDMAGTHTTTAISAITGLPGSGKHALLEIARFCLSRTT